MIECIYQNLPTILRDQVDVNSIQLFRNQLRIQPSEIVFSNSSIQVILSGLKYVDLSKRQINTLYLKHLSAYTTLQSLKLKSNKLQDLPPQLSQLKNLTELDLSDNCLESLPHEIGDMTALEVLNVGNNSNLDYLPPSLSAIESIKIIKIHGTDIKDISSAFQAFVQNDGKFVLGTSKSEYPHAENFSFKVFWEF